MARARREMLKSEHGRHVVDMMLCLRVSEGSVRDAHGVHGETERLGGGLLHFACKSPKVCVEGLRKSS